MAWPPPVVPQRAQDEPVSREAATEAVPIVCGCEQGNRGEVRQGINQTRERDADAWAKCIDSSSKTRTCERYDTIVQAAAAVGATANSNMCWVFQFTKQKVGAQKGNVRVEFACARKFAVAWDMRNGYRFSSQTDPPVHLIVGMVITASFPTFNKDTTNLNIATKMNSLSHPQSPETSSRLPRCPLLENAGQDSRTTHACAQVNTRKVRMRQPSLGQRFFATTVTGTQEQARGCCRVEGHGLGWCPGGTILFCLSWCV